MSDETSNGLSSSTNRWCAMKGAQLDLLAARGDRQKRPTGAERLVARMLGAPERHGGGWVAGRVLAAEPGIDLRTLRDTASRSAGRILGHQKGYALTVAVPLNDVHAVSRRLLSQSAEMRRRVADIERVRHGSGLDVSAYYGGAA